MERFQELKNEILRKAKEVGACSSGYDRAEQSENEADLMQVIKDYFGWCCCSGVLNDEILTKFKDEFSRHKIFYNVHISESADFWALLSGDFHATIETWGSSNATIETRGSSNATIKTWGSSNATIETWGSSNATIKTRESSNATIETRGYSIVTTSIECQLNEFSIQRVSGTKIIRYASNELVFEKV